MARLGEPEFAPALNPQVEVARQKVGNISQPEDRIKTKSVGRDLPFLLDGDFLKVRNLDNAKTQVFRWARKAYTLEPGQEGFVPFEALVDVLGDPRSNDDEVVRYNDGNGTRGIVMRRHEELSRGFARYAVENESIDVLQSRAPNVAVETLNGQRVVFPFQRPDMLPFPVPMVDEKNLAKPVDSATIDRINADNEELREQIGRLTERLDAELKRREGVDSGV